ncbi:MAG: DUF4491 family protein [Paramuribaculum sp.]|nr:DUF4491 family protein [Paramuribaculum sp.]
MFETQHFIGLATGLITFLIIGAFHPLVIKCHYYYGTKCWWWFLVLGLISCAASIYVGSLFWSTVLGVLAFSSFWTIGEVFEQEKRVAKGWFPANPKRNGGQHRKS